jgi:hypothetical protein
MNNHLFCRELLKQSMTDVRKVFSSDEIRQAWAWGDGRTGGYRSFEFHGPNGEYEYSLRAADCKWSAMAEGWQRLLATAEPRSDRGSNEEVPQ